MADVVVAKYKADLKDYNAQIKKGTGQAEKDFNKVDESASGLSKTVGKLGAALAAAFAADKIISFTAEASKLAAEGEGIRKAFERVGDPRLLQGLRDATRGTVSDLELMKNAVKASNFKIPLQELAKLFEFARRRAKETGESVQFLVESITTGIGRKSPLILDNLGISAIELKKRLNGVSLEAASIGDISQVVGEIASDAMRQMGDEVDNAKDKMDKLGASTKNFMEQIGIITNKSFVGAVAELGSKGLDKVVEHMSQVDQFRFSLVKKSAFELVKIVNDQQEAYDELIETMKTADDEGTAVAIEQLKTQGQKLAVAKQALKAFQGGDIDFGITEDDIDTAIRQRAELEEQEKSNIKNVAFWTAEIKRLQEELRNGDATIEENKNTVNELTHAQEELNKILGKVKASSKAFNDTLDKEAKHNVEGMTGAVYGLADALKEANKGFSAEDQIQAELNAIMYKADFEIDEDNRAKEQRKRNIEEITELAINSAYRISDLISAANQRAIEYDQLMLDKKLADGLISEKQFAQETAKLKRKSAQQSKETAMFEATLGTANAVVAALSETGLPYYLKVINAAAAAAFGAVEIATIASQPIPQFAKGTKNAPAGFKWVGEEGPELIYDQGGYPIITHKESMKILEKYNIPTVDIGKIEAGGWGGVSESSKLQGFNDMNLLVATDRLRTTNSRKLDQLIYVIEKSNSKRVRRGGYA